jgi:hypothetical protein
LNCPPRDIAEEKQKELLCRFPEVRIEGGQIDFERLKLALDEAERPSLVQTRTNLYVRQSLQVHQQSAVAVPGVRQGTPARTAKGV